MNVNPYLLFDGRCEEAFKYYEKVLGGKIEAMMAFAGSPMADKVPPDWQNKIMHTSLRVADTVLMGSDERPEHFAPARSFAVMIGVTDPNEAERIFHALAENGTVKMPIQETFWASRFGSVVDQFGTPWMINSEKSA